MLVNMDTTTDDEPSIKMSPIRDFYLVSEQHSLFQILQLGK